MRKWHRVRFKNDGETVELVTRVEVGTGFIRGGTRNHYALAEPDGEDGYKPFSMTMVPMGNGCPDSWHPSVAAAKKDARSVVTEMRDAIQAKVAVVDRIEKAIEALTDD